MNSYLRRKRVPTRDTNLGPPSRRWRFIPALAVGVTLLVGGVLPATSFAVVDIGGVRFVDTNPGSPEDNPGTGDTSFIDGGYIILKHLSNANTQPTATVADSDGNYAHLNVDDGEYLIWQYIDPTWLTDITSIPTIQWSSQESALKIKVENNAIYRLDKPSAVQVTAINFPFPDLTDNSNKVETAKSKAESYCEQPDVVLCGTDAPSGCQFEPAEIQGDTPIGKWPAASGTVDKKVATYGEIKVPYNSNNADQQVKVKGLCNYGTLTNEMDVNVKELNLRIWFTEQLANFGKIVSLDASSYSKKGSNIYLVGEVELDFGTTTVGTFYNGGNILGGNGAKVQGYSSTTTSNNGERCTVSSLELGNWVCNRWWNGFPKKSILQKHFKEDVPSGGSVEITAEKIYLDGKIAAGQGTNVWFNKHGEAPYWIAKYDHLRFGGKGGDVSITAKGGSGTSGEIIAVKGSKTSGGNGGSVTVKNTCSNCSKVEAKGGKGGNLTLNGEDLKLGGGFEGSSVFIDPVITFAGEDLQITAEEDVVIFGGDNYELNLNNLGEGAITAGRDITLAVGDGGKIDLTGNTRRIFKAANKVEINAENVIVDDDVKDIIEAKETVVIPQNKIIYRVTMSGQKLAKGQPGTTVPMSLTVYNAGSTEDTYTLNAVSKAGWNVSGLPSSVTVKGLAQNELVMNVTLPATQGMADTITVTATSQADATVVATTEMIATTAQQPTAGFGISAISGIAPLTINLDASASADLDGDITNYGWSASDGQTATGKIVTLTFNNIGEYTVTLEVTDDDGTTAQVQKMITVQELPNELPTAAASIIQTSGKDQLFTVALDGSASTDTDGEIVSYTWLASDGQIAMGQNAELTFNEAGEYTIALDVTDNDEATVQVQKVISVQEISNELPTAALAITPETGEAPLTIALDGSTSTDTDGTIASYKWTASNGQTANGQTAELTFSEAGDYTITLEVTDNEGATAQVQKAISVSVQEAPNELPTAALAITPETGEAPLTIALDGSASSDTDGTIASHVWTASNGQTANGQTAELTFSEAGDYTITLEVTDNNDATNSATKNVKVEAAANYVASGTIRDKAGNPVAGVTVQIGDKTVVTNEAGDWEITGLPEGDDYTATASKDGYTFAPIEFALGNEVFKQEVVMKPLSAINVKVVAEPTAPKQGENITFIATVINGGSETATGVALTNVLSSGSLVSIEALDGGECDADTVICTLPDLTTGATAKVKLVVSNSAANKVANEATVTANEYPADVHKKSVNITPHLSVSASCTPQTVMPEGGLHCTAEVVLSSLAPNAATGVELVMTLPNGVELQSLNTDYGMCDVSNMPILTCSMTDLSVDSPDDISSVAVNFEEVLQDPGLLALTHDVKVTANGYPAHTSRARTKIFIPPEYQVDFAIVIDVTGSMEKEMDGTKSAVNNFIKGLKAQNQDSPLTALVVFRDEVMVKAVTTDLSLVETAISKMEASGGGTCPEASVEALDVAITHVKEGGTIFFVTDASPYEDADVAGIMERMGTKGIIFNAIITGDCTNKDSWNVQP